MEVTVPASSNDIVLVTGGTGFLGLHLVPCILKQGVAVRLYCRTRPDHVEHGVTVCLGSVTDVDALARAAQGCRGIYHLAGMVVHSRTVDTAAMRECNVDGTLSVLRAAVQAGCRRVVYASSSGVVGCSHDAQFVASDASPYCEDVVRHWPYYAGKIEAERLALEFAARHNVELVCMRPSMMWGPGDDRFRSTKLVLSFLTRHVPFTPPGGVSLVDIRDVADAFVQAMNAPRVGRTYLLGSLNASTSDLFALLESLTGVKKPAIAAPAFVAQKGAYLLDLVNRRVRGKYDASVDPVRGEMSCAWWNISSAAAERDLGFKPRPAKQTILDTVAFIRQTHPDLRKVRAKL